jgi:cell fate (sporulation/competence/biofilm development) regulator YmcA (YheA/YmcA/DUF963 family)
MSKARKAAYQQKFEAKLEEQQAELSKLKAKAKGGVADARIDAHNAIEKAEKKVEGLRARVAELIEAGEDAWADLTDGIERAWDDVTDAVASAWKKLRG